MNEASRFQTPATAAAVEADRAIPTTMRDLTEAIGELESAVRAMCGRISPLLPAGDPFANKTGEGTNTPRPVRSEFCESLAGRLAEVRGITAYVNQVVRSIEI